MSENQTLNKPASPSAEEVRIGEARLRLENLAVALKRTIIGHDGIIDAALLALASKEHMVMIGPPGTAKTFLVTTLAKLLNARYYTYLMTTFTILDELAGPIDVLELTKGNLRRRWSAIVEADIVFLDEIFKASSAILNSLLSFMQERVLYDPFTGTAMPVRAWTVFAASNETPRDGEELQALYDRFAIKTFIRPIGSNADLVRNALNAKWLNPPKAEPVATMEDVRAIHEYATSLLQREDVLKLYLIHMVPMIEMARSKGVFISDRTELEKLPKLFAAYLALHGVSEMAAAEAAYKLIDLMAREPAELAEIEKAKNEMLGELAELQEKLENAKKQYELTQLQSALDMFREIALLDVSKFEGKPWLAQRAQALVEEAQRYIAKIQEARSRLKML
jgi:MoxR-like ATPase